MLGTCLTQLSTWSPALITLVIVFVTASTISKIAPKNILLLTLLPARVIILGVLWSGSPSHESVELDMSFNEVSVGVGFLLLVKSTIVSSYETATDRNYLGTLVLLSVVSLLPASVDLIYLTNKITAQMLTGTLSTVVVAILYSTHTKEGTPDKEIKLDWRKILEISAFLAGVTFLSSLAGCCELELWAGLICAYPIDAIIILNHIMKTNREDKKTGKKEKYKLLLQIVHLIAITCYVHYVMNVIIYSASKLDIIRNLEGYWPVAAMLIIAAIAAIIVFLLVDAFGFATRTGQTATNLLKRAGRFLDSVKQDDSTEDEALISEMPLSTSEPETSSRLQYKYEKVPLRL